MKGAEIFDLSGRVTIVTGGSVGLGRQMAEGLAKMGANLVLCGRKKERCEQAAAELEKCGVRALGLACDVKDPGSIQAVVDATVSEFGRIDVLINNAGTSWGAPTEEMTLEQRRRTPDPVVDEFIRKCAKEENIPQHKISSEEIADGCLYALINEGARILEEGYALRASDIDIIYLNGYGFPDYRGGPMWYADTCGIKQVYERICEFQRQHGESWSPAPLLKQLAEQGSTFADFDKQKSTAK